jgi:hypothetical protein
MPSAVPLRATSQLQRADQRCGVSPRREGARGPGTAATAFVKRCRACRAARSLGGYRVIAMCDEDKLSFLERRFAHFESITDVRGSLDALPYLTPSLLGVRAGSREGHSRARDCGRIGTDDSTSGGPERSWPG